LALANALAANPDLSDQDQATVSQLVQQSIREAKNAIAIDPNNAIYWTNLAGIYQQLINLAEGADQWTIASYQQAATLEPTNPALALSLGGVYYSLKTYGEAINWFQRSVNLKPDFANGYYNLAIAHRDAGDYAQAAGAMQAVLGLVEADSGDYQIASRELDDIKSKLQAAQPQQETAEPETLTPPQPLPSPIEEPIQLPQEEVAPPPVSPSPSPAQEEIIEPESDNQPQP
jgi:predicted Zn-dependent protease